jgi:hypothetical protein
VKFVAFHGDTDKDNTTPAGKKNPQIAQRKKKAAVQVGMVKNR